VTREHSAWARRSLAATRVSRLRAIVLLAGGCYLAVFVRAVQVHLFPDPRLAPLLTQQTRAFEPKLMRGNIVDREGRALIVRGDTRSLQAFPEKIADKPDTARKLAQALGASENWLLGKLQREGGSVFLVRWLEPDAAERVAELDLPGIELVPERRGQYPSGPLAAALLGFTGYDGIAREGLELVFDDELTPDASQPADEDDELNGLALRGATVRLALDARLQHEGERALAEALEKTGAKQGSLIAIDPHTGDV